MKISCICGYVYEKEYSDDTPTQGDEPFHEIECDSKRGFIVSNLNRGWYESDYYEVELMACPKCGTIRMAHHFSLLEKE